MSDQQMSSVDAAWLHMDHPTNPMVVNSLLWFDERVDPERNTELVRERLVERFPRFRQRVVEPRAGVGLPRWEDDPEFDLDRHVHRIALPPPRDAGALRALVGELISSPLDRSKPLWDIYLIDGPGEGMAQLSRFHHCIADGVALARVLISMTDASPDAGFEAEQSGAEEGAPAHHGLLARSRAAGAHLVGMALHEGIEVASHPGSELRALLSGTAQDSRTLAKLLLASPDGATGLRGKLDGRQTVSWTDAVALDDVKAIGGATGATVNDVLVTAVTGALRTCLQDRHELVDDLRAMVPFNLRPLDRPLPRELGNRFGLAYLQLPVGIGERRRRLTEIHRRMELIKHTPEPAIAYGILGLIGLTPAQIEQRLVDVFASKCTLVLTNVAGPPQPVYLAGAPVAGVIPWVPAGGAIGLGISIFSYAGAVTLGVRADRALKPGPELIVEALEHELVKLARLRGSPPRSGSSRRRDPAPPAPAVR